MSQAAQNSSPFMTLQTGLGASFADYRGHRMAQRFSTSADDEYQALVEGCGLFDRSFHDSLVMTGDDRQRFLNGLVTCDTKALEAGESSHGFVTSVKGRNLAYLSVLALEDQLWLELPPGSAPDMQTHLSKYIIVDRVEIAPLPWTSVALLGPAAADFLKALGLDVDGLTAGQHRPGRVGDHGVRLLRDRDLGTTPQWILWCSVATAAAVYQELVHRGKDDGTARPVGFAAFERLRIEAGWPLFGVDYDSDHFPQETGLDDAVSYTKGCYLGQEIVARIHYRGGVNKRLRTLRPERFDEQAVGGTISLDGRAAGSLTSLTQSHDGPLGLAILHKRVEDGAEVEIEGLGKAEVLAHGGTEPT